MKRIKLLTVLCIAVIVTACTKDNSIVIMSLEQEIALGEKTDSAILADPVEFPVLNREGNDQIYNYVDQMMLDILASNEILYRDEFDWEVTIINKDVKNAFAVPGGNLYFYTGLMKYLDNGAQLAGVMAHEIAHVDKRHSNKQITKAYGVNFILSLLLGDSESQLQQIASDMASGLISLQFSRKHEYEADEYSIKYLTDTKYDPKGIEGFFLKLEEDGETGNTFPFLSTHPSDQDRINNINKIWKELDEPIGNNFTTEYNELKDKL